VVTDRNSLHTCSCYEERKFMLVSPETGGYQHVAETQDHFFHLQVCPEVIFKQHAVQICWQSPQSPIRLHGVMSHKTRILNFTTVKTSRNWSPSLDPCSVVRDANLQLLLFTFLLFAAYSEDRLDGLRRVPSHNIWTRGP
jgi:hypothetical protein